MFLVKIIFFLVFINTSVFAITTTTTNTNTSTLACPLELSSWIEAVNVDIQQLATIALKTEKMELEYKLRVQSAEQVFASYLQGVLDLKLLDDCLANQNKNNSFAYWNTLQKIFIQKSLEKLQNVKSKIINQIIQIYKEEYKEESMPCFHLVNKEMNLDSIGGFFRSNNSIFMNFYKIDPNQWLLILIHEIIHSIDQKLIDASKKYSNTKLIKHFVELNNNFNDYIKLEKQDQNDLNDWLLAGLDRGFLAEHRAWTKTFNVYIEGVEEGLWIKIPWMEAVLMEKNLLEKNNEFAKINTAVVTNNNMELFLLCYLNKRFIDPATGIFSLPLIKSGLKNLKNNLTKECI